MAFVRSFSTIGIVKKLGNSPISLRTMAHAGPMPSLPPRDGVDALLCAGIHAGTSTVSSINTHSSVAGTSLPPPPTREHEAIGCPSGISLSPPRVLCKHGGGSPHTRPHDCLYGSMTPLPATTEAAKPLLSSSSQIWRGAAVNATFVFGLHRLWWQHRFFLLGLRGHNLYPTSHPTPLPHVSNWPTGIASIGSHYTTIPLSL